MGTSTDAIVWFGLCESECEGKLPETVRAKILAMPQAQLPDFDEDDGDADTLVDKLLREHGCELVLHCSSEFTMYGIAIRDTEIRAWRGTPKPVTGLAVDPQWIPKLMAAAESIGWKVGDVGWWLASYWG